MTNPQELPRLLRAFPALQRLGRRIRGKRIPFVQQMELADCGPACLAMVLGYHGKDVRLGEVREVAGATSRSGVSALGLKEAAQWYGLRCRAVWFQDVNQFEYVNTASIVHLKLRNRDHFVVFERMTDKGVDIVDPDPHTGRCRLSVDRFNKLFTGTVLEFEPAEGFRPAAGDRAGVWPYLKQVISQSGVLRRVLVTSVLVQAFALTLPFLTRMLIDRRGGDHDLLMVVGVGLLAVVLFSFLSSIIRAHLLLHLRTHVDLQLTLSFVEHLVGLPYGFFQKRSTGDLVMRLNSNATVREVVTSSVLAGLLDGTLVTLYLIILLVTSPLMTGIVLALAVLQGGMYVVARRRYRDLMAQELGAQAEAQSYEVQMLAGIETLKAAGAERRASEYWSNLFVDVLNITLDRGRLSALVDSLLATLRMASPLLILWVAAFLVLRKDITLGEMFQINALAGGLLVPFSGLVGTALQLTTLRSYIERINDVLEEAPEQETRGVSRARTLQGKITLERVSFRYGLLAPMVVEDVSLDIEPGRQIALVGPSGSGKSTLARLLISLYTPTKGRILYDAVDLAGLEYGSVRRQIGFVPQNPYLFGTTILANITLTDPTLSREAAAEAAKLAHIDDLITDRERMPLGYDTLLADGGASLSGGERQRIALARALVQKPPILVLDEATSDLDPPTESAIQKELDSLACTRIIIAHRPSTFINADCIFYLEEGRVLEQGSHGQLLARNGRYAAFVSGQARPQGPAK